MSKANRVRVRHPPSVSASRCHLLPPGEGNFEGEGVMQVLQPADWARPRGFSHGLVVDKPGRWVVLAGQTGTNEQGDYDDDFAAQVASALKRIVRLVREAGGGPEHIVRLNWYITKQDEYEAA